MLKYNCITLIICCIMKNSVDVINLLTKANYYSKEQKFNSQSLIDNSL